MARSPLYLRPQPTPAFLRWLLMFQRSCARSTFDRGYAAVARFAQAAFECFAELADAGVLTSLTRPGLLHAYLSVREAERTLATQRVMAWTGYDLPGEILMGKDARTLDPALGGEVAAAYLVPGEGLVDPRAFVASLADRLRQERVSVTEQVAVQGFRRRGARVVAVSTDAGDIDCSSVVVAAGTWSADLLARLGVRLPLQAGKG
jgi:D-amino-acid dehydrogenase